MKKSATNDPTRVKKALIKWQKKYMTPETRITILGCTSEPHEGSKKDFKKFFNKSIYFPLPDYTTRRLMWRTFITEFGGIIKPEFPLSTLAHISDGYSAGSIKNTCEKVLTKYRKEKMSTNPLRLAEFIGPLSLSRHVYPDLFEEFVKFTDFISGDEKRRKDIAAAANPDGADANPKKGKKKGKK